MHESDLLKKKKKKKPWLLFWHLTSENRIHRGGKNLTDLLQRAARTEAHYRNNSDTCWFLQD